jgi:hypothetical protein
VLLWGHSAGTALAVATARALHERGIEVARLFLAAQLPRDARERRAAADRLLAQGDAEIAAGLAGYGEFAPQQAEHVGAAYRHDCVAAHRYFADLIDAAPAPLPSRDGRARGGRPEHRRVRPPRVAGGGRARRSRTAPRRGSPLPAHPAARRGRGGHTAQRDCSPAADTSDNTRGICTMSPSTTSARLPVQTAPGKPPLLGRAGRRPGRRLDRRPPGRRCAKRC